MDELLAAAKNYLDITWEDQEGDKKLSGILERGKTYLNRIAGEDLDFSEGTRGRELLLDYTRYVRAGCLQDFAGDFSMELNTQNVECEVRRYAGQSQAADL